MTRKGVQMFQAVPFVQFHRTFIFITSIIITHINMSHKSGLRRRGLHSGVLFLEFLSNIVIVSLQRPVNVQTHVIVAAKHACLVKLLLEFNVVQ